MNQKEAGRVLRSGGEGHDQEIEEERRKEKKKKEKKKKEKKTKKKEGEEEEKEEEYQPNLDLGYDHIEIK